ncbi:MAG: bifunctional diaminohydroxyphosphoribosylaminopyrimidine deaminase/5-amino-6-(5-phosphoribosylamino)uracil reductase RibD [Candidatus Oxydemutatoraceae bacterium WSBS_2016_MAG_OTU14]
MAETFSDQDKTYMCRALELAHKGLTTTFPNPRVGCVIVQNDTIVGEGYHQYAGEPHAEVLALKQAGDKAQGATLYVTLEPCTHQGKTPPCCPHIIERGIVRVVVAVKDPSKKVCGKGIEALQASGIQVAVGVMMDSAIDLNCGFFKRHQKQRPWVRIKSAITLDGRIALNHGKSNWISSQASQRDVQFWRARSDVLLTSSGTVNIDNPRMTVRLTAEELGIDRVRQLQCVVVDSNLKTSPSATIYKQQAIVAHCSQNTERIKAFEEAGILLWRFNSNEQGRVPLVQLMNRLAQDEWMEVQVEAGTGLVGALLAENLCDELLLYVAPCVYGRGPLFLDSEQWGQTLNNNGFVWKETQQIDTDFRMRLHAKTH